MLPIGGKTAGQIVDTHGWLWGVIGKKISNIFF